jgi:hypothetical protein
MGQVAPGTVLGAGGSLCTRLCGFGCGGCIPASPKVSRVLGPCRAALAAEKAGADKLRGDGDAKDKAAAALQAALDKVCRCWLHHGPCFRK